MLVDYGSARRVDQVGGGFHQVEGCGVDVMVGAFEVRNVKRHVIGAFQEFIFRHERHFVLNRKVFADVGVVVEHVEETVKVWKVVNPAALAKSDDA